MDDPASVNATQLETQTVVTVTNESTFNFIFLLLLYAGVGVVVVAFCVTFQIVRKLGEFRTNNLVLLDLDFGSWERK